MEDFYNAMTTYINSKKPKKYVSMNEPFYGRMENLRRM